MPALLDSLTATQPLILPLPTYTGGPASACANGRVKHIFGMLAILEDTVFERGYPHWDSPGKHVKTPAPAPAQVQAKSLESQSALPTTVSNVRPERRRCAKLHGKDVKKLSENGPFCHSCRSDLKSLIRVSHRSLGRWEFWKRAEREAQRTSRGR